jgi:hypothetical protein
MKTTKLQKNGAELIRGIWASMTNDIFGLAFWILAD